MKRGLSLSILVVALALIVLVGTAMTWPWAARQMNEVFPPRCHGVGIYPERDADGFWICTDSNL